MVHIHTKEMFLKTLRGHDWIRVLFVACSVSYLGYRICKSTDRLLERQMGSTEITNAAQDLLLPSVTICVESVSQKTEGSANISNDYMMLPKLDKMLGYLTQIVSTRNRLV